MVPPIFIEPVIVEERADTWGAIYNLGLDYQGYKTNYGLSLSQDINVRTGRSEPTLFNRASFDVSHKLRARINIGLTILYFQNRSIEDFSFGEFESETYNFLPNLNWQITQNLSINAAYIYTVRGRGDTDSDSRRNNVLVQLTYGGNIFN